MKRKELLLGGGAEEEMLVEVMLDHKKEIVCPGQEAKSLFESPG
jgi:hypothetical protein